MAIMPTNKTGTNIDMSSIRAFRLEASLAPLLKSLDTQIISINIINTNEIKNANKPLIKDISLNIINTKT